jgi:ATP synthase F1 complex assembly factor 2
LITRAIRYVDSLDAWTLAALYSSCAESKSFFIGAALIHEAMSGCDGGGAVPAGGGRGDGDDDGEDDDASSRSTKNDVDLPRDGRWASEAARVEEEFNIECWGLVEGGHDYDRLNCSIQMHAASFLARTVASG